MRSLITTAASDPVILRRQFVRALGQRLGCNPEDFTRDGALERALRRAGVSEKTASSCERLLRELDAAAYAGDRAIPAGAGKDAAALARAVDGEALARSELPFWIPALFLVVSLGLAGTAIAADTAETYFARGVSAYVRQDFAAAKRAFAGAASLAPRSADAWANYGTASWTAADTSAAVLGWRQALAIQPGAEDLQQRLELVRHQGPLSPGWVPPLPRGAPFLSASSPSRWRSASPGNGWRSFVAPAR
jgi:tetratricopeptide (TPR) repeat protein